MGTHTGPVQAKCSSIPNKDRNVPMPLHGELWIFPLPPIYYVFIWMIMATDWESLRGGDNFLVSKKPLRLGWFLISLLTFCQKYYKMAWCWEALFMLPSQWTGGREMGDPLPPPPLIYFYPSISLGNARQCPLLHFSLTTVLWVKLGWENVSGPSLFSKLYERWEFELRLPRL